MVDLYKVWNSINVKEVKEKPYFAKRGLILLGTKSFPTKINKDVWEDPNKFITNAVSMPFTKRVAQKIIVIAPTRYGKTTLINRIINDLTNNFDCRVACINPKGKDGYYATQKGKGRYLGPGETNTFINYALYKPLFAYDSQSLLQRRYQTISYDISDFDPMKDAGFLEFDEEAKFNSNLYTTMGRLYDTFPYLKGMTIESMIKFLNKESDGRSYIKNKFYINSITRSTLINRLEIGLLTLSMNTFVMSFLFSICNHGEGVYPYGCSPTEQSILINL